LAETAVDLAEKIIFWPLETTAKAADIGLVRQHLPAVHRLPFRLSSVISRPFIARLIKGCRGDVRADYGLLEII
jgi:hypothetical protein